MERSVLAGIRDHARQRGDQASIAEFVTSSEGRHQGEGMGTAPRRIEGLLTEESSI
jgi:hypothetical protein